MSEKFGLKHMFFTAGTALAIDLLLVFPLSHNSIIGNMITSLSSAVVVPPVDALAGVFGMESGAEQLMSLGSSMDAAGATGSMTSGAPALTAPTTGFESSMPYVPQENLPILSDPNELVF